MVLLFQFKNLKEVGLVMLTIPLSLFGAIFGLFITGNDFGFTAFTALISLSGIVVRNAIILIDHTNELLRKGLDIPTAAYEAGKRRLRLQRRDQQVRVNVQSRNHRSHQGNPDCPAERTKRLASTLERNPGVATAVRNLGTTGFKVNLLNGRQTFGITFTTEI
jgi:hypothetical protein